MDIEELYALLNMERRTKSLQRFPEKEIKQYLSRLRAIQRKLLMSEEEWKRRRRVEEELEMAENYVRDIIKFRARKVANCAIFASLVSMSPLVSCTKDMTDGEREIFLNLCEQLRMMYKKLVSEEVQKNDKH